MSEKLFYARTQEGEQAEITLSSLMAAKWDSSGELIRCASDIGTVEVLARSISDVDGVNALHNNEKLLAKVVSERDALKAENERLRAALEKIIDCIPSDEYRGNTMRLILQTAREELEAK